MSRSGSASARAETYRARAAISSPSADLEIWSSLGSADFASPSRAMSVSSRASLARWPAALALATASHRTSRLSCTLPCAAATTPGPGAVRSGRRPSAAVPRTRRAPSSRPGTSLSSAAASALRARAMCRVPTSELREATDTACDAHRRASCGRPRSRAHRASAAAIHASHRPRPRPEPPPSPSPRSATPRRAGPPPPARTSPC